MAWDISNIIINLERRIKKLEGSSASIATTSTAGIVKPDGTTITITSDGTISGAATGRTYSTSEQEVGTWIDGKTLYEKTITYTLTGSETTVIDIDDLSDLSADSIFIDEAHYAGTDGLCLPNCFNSAADYSIAFRVYVATVGLRVSIASYYITEGAQIIATIRYTKEEDE